MKKQKITKDIYIAEDGNCRELKNNVNLRT